MSAKRRFVRALKEEMARQGISRGDLARDLGCTDANVAQMLHEDRTHGMRLHTVDRLAEALGCGVVLVLTTQLGAEAAVAQWQQAARRNGVSLWEWLTVAVERSLGRDTINFWLSQGLSTRAANALADAKIRSWSQLEALNRKELLALRNLGKSSVRKIEERRAQRAFEGDSRSKSRKESGGA